uniref:PALP domain-containing protein n=1 Tax=Dracunculus medinensis TaxID=318479 RepID=A0A0N4U8U1_DRAME
LNSWRSNAIAKLWEERAKMGRTPMFKLTSPAFRNIEILFKNETASRTGSVKHRYSWALIMWAVVDGKINENTTVYEASSGNTATSEAYMCQLIGVKFVAIVPDTIEDVKVEHIREHGGEVIKTEIGKRLIRAEMEAKKNGGFFMNQFANSDRAEEFHESGNFDLESTNMMHEILSQLNSDRSHSTKIPHYFVHSAGTGGTISSVGRYSKKYGLRTNIVLADTQFSVYYDYVMNARFSNESGEHFWRSPGMAGIGYGPMGPVKHGVTSSLLSVVIDRAIKIHDLASTAAMLVLQKLGIDGGTSSGTNFVACLHIAAAQRSVADIWQIRTQIYRLFLVSVRESSIKNDERIVIATILADPGHYYKSTYYNRTWIGDRFKSLGGLYAYDCWVQEIQEALRLGFDPLISGHKMCDYQ